MKKWIALLLALCMTAMMIPAFAEEADESEFSKEELAELLKILAEVKDEDPGTEGIQASDEDLTALIDRMIALFADDTEGESREEFPLAEEEREELLYFLASLDPENLTEADAEILAAFFLNMIYPAEEVDVEYVETDD